MNIENELEIILRCKKLMSEAFSFGGGEQIEFIQKGNKYMYFATTSPYKETRYYRIDDLLDTFQLKGSKWEYSITI
ncbi:hypothetical protein [Bacillus sp. FSL R9-9410]|uniref:hypothetical protein n=1 Tax=Bacillus sp. FSL R9-9410 TaxID=2921590 RepID=UPI003100BB6B